MINYTSNTVNLHCITVLKESCQVFQPDTPSVEDYAKPCYEGQSIGTREIISLLYCIAKEFHVLIKILSPNFESGGGELETF